MSRKKREALTEQAVAESVPNARGRVPHPSSLYARDEGEVDPDDGHQEIAHADVDQQQVGGRPQPLEPVVEQEDHHVVAEAQHSDGPDGEGEEPVRARSE